MASGSVLMPWSSLGKILSAAARVDQYGLISQVPTFG